MTFEPKIVGFLCNWCSYTGADLAGTSRIHYAPNVRVIRVMCSARIDPTFVIKALADGADGVLVCGCHPGDCHYSEGNYKTMRRMPLLKRMLADFGIEDERVRLEWVSASEGQRFADIVDDMTERLRELGPSPGEAGARRRRRWRGDPWPVTNCRSPSTGAPPAAAATSPSSTPTRSSSTSPRRPTSASGPSPWTASTRTSRRWRTASSTSTIFNGAVRNSENEHIAKLLRQQEQAAGRLRVVRPPRRHPRARQPDLARGDPEHGVPRQSQPRAGQQDACPLPESGVNGSDADDPQLLQARLQAGRHRAGRLLRPRLPAGLRSGQGGAAGRGGRRAAGQAARWSGASDGRSATTARASRTRRRIKHFYRPWQIMIDPDALPAGAGDPLRRTGDPVRVRGALPVQRHALPRLLRPAAQTSSTRAPSCSAPSPRSSTARTRRRSTGSSTACRTSPASPTVSACRPHCCRGASGHEQEDQHRPHHPARGPRQDRDLPRRRRRRRGLLLPDPRAARLRALRGRPADRGAAAPRHAHLRRLPGQPPPGQRQGRRRLLRRRGARRWP